MFIYNENSNMMEELENDAFFDYDGMKWMHFENPQDKFLHTLMKNLEIHPLGVTLLTQFSNIPKYYVFKKSIIVSMFCIQENFNLVKFSALIGPHYIITVSDHEDPHFFEKLIQDFKKAPEQMSTLGMLLYYVLFELLNTYLEFVDHVANRIESLEQQVFKTPFENQIGKQIYRLKRRLHHIRRSFEPLEGVLLAISENKHLTSDSGIYFDDLMHKFNRVINAFDHFTDSLNAIFNLQMSLKADRTNDIVKTLTLFSVIFIPITFIVGLYGMNFKYMPELNWHYSYPCVLLSILIIAGGIAIYFKKKGWW